MQSYLPRRRALAGGGSPGGVTPASFASLLLWLKADSFALADGTAIGDGGNEWQDQSSNNRDAFQTESTARRPLFKTNILGSMPGVLFDASNDYLAISPTISLGTGTEYTILAVSKLSGTGIGAAAFCQDSGVQQFYRRDNGVSTYTTGGTPWNHSDAFTTAQNSVVVASVRRPSTDSYGKVYFRENKTARGTGTGSGANYQWNIHRIGNRDENFLNGYMFEFCVWQYALTDGEIDDLYDNYFKTRWPGLP